MAWSFSKRGQLIFCPLITSTCRRACNAWYLTTLPDCATAAAAIDLMKSKLLVGAMQSFHASSPIHQWQRGLPHLPRIGSLSRGWARLQTQKEYFKENWIRRGVPTTEVICVNELGFSISVADGLANDGWLNRLKKSARNRKLCCSVRRKVLPSVKSTFFCGGPITQLRGSVP